jgi:DNA mismatch endonuclease (patch repair protein)
MADIFSKAKRSDIMRAVRSRDTGPELKLATLLRSMHVRYRRNAKSLPGQPDFVLPELRVAILVHGCFWHQHKDCVKARLPKSNRKFWLAKLRRNVTRDRRTVRALRRLDLKVLTIWECQMTNRDDLMKRLERMLRAGVSFTTLPASRSRELTTVSRRGKT